MSTESDVLKLHRRNRLFSALALATGAAWAGSAFAVTVTNCYDDNRAGSLRTVVSTAATGATVDMSGLSIASPGCVNSKITLGHGDIVVAQNNLTVIGPGKDTFSIDGNHTGRVFRHTARGTLTLQDFSVINGSATGYGASGGCIESYGSVVLHRMKVEYCTAYDGVGTGAGAAGLGGGISTSYSLTLTDSILASNTATHKSALGQSEGGGARVFGGGITLINSLIAGNVAGTPGLRFGNYGGLDLIGSSPDDDVIVLNSSIVGNIAATSVGGASLSATNVSIVNSTISSNVALSGDTGGLTLYASATKIYNSTVSDNISALNPGGVFISSTDSTRIESTLMANTVTNTAQAPDLTMKPGTPAIVGSHNLIRFSSATLPADTITAVCPLLGRVRNNGGSTLTVALQSTSPAIDHGDNVANTGSMFGYPQDQRGEVGAPPPYSYPRVSGAAADIGAYEVNQDDVIFTSSLEGCPD